MSLSKLLEEIKGNKLVKNMEYAVFYAEAVEEFKFRSFFNGTVIIPKFGVGLNPKLGFLPNGIQRQL